jgi:hypothetical protein
MAEIPPYQYRLYAKYYIGANSNIPYHSKGDEWLSVYDGIYEKLSPTRTKPNRRSYYIRMLGHVNITQRKFYKGSKIFHSVKIYNNFYNYRDKTVIRNLNNSDENYVLLNTLLEDLKYPVKLYDEISEVVVREANTPKFEINYYGFVGNLRKNRSVVSF